MFSRLGHGRTGGVGGGCEGWQRAREDTFCGPAASDSQGGREASSVETPHSLNERSFSSPSPPFFLEIILILIMTISSRCVLRVWHAVALEETLAGTRRFPSAF